LSEENLPEDPPENSRRESPPIEISIDDISPEAVQGIIENFILREGTDYGLVNVPFEKKVAQIRSQLKRGEIKIIYDPASESVTLITKQEFARLINSEKNP
jgi:uncharacterized protein YheU (UPF0270 family)